MIAKLRYLLIAAFAVVEGLAWTIAVPVVALAMVAWGLLACARFASARVRLMIPPPTRASQAAGYGASGESSKAHAHSGETQIATSATP
jgi:hypothetical protein